MGKSIVEEYHEFALSRRDFGVAKNSAFRIVEDIEDRKGFSSQWDSMDLDIQEEVLTTWINIIQKALSFQSDAERGK